MAAQANVRSIETLVQLKTGFNRYSYEAQAALQGVNQELVRTHEWLAERQRYWQAQVQRCRQAVQEAQVALRRCQNDARIDAQEHRHIPDCLHYENVMMHAVAKLREAEAELNTVRHWILTVDQAVQVYQRQAVRLVHVLDGDLIKAETVLAQKIDSLQAYLALGSPAASATFLTTAPLDVLTDNFANSLALGALGVVGPALYLLRQMAGNIRAALGDTGESLVTRLLQEQFDWQEVAFDQPKHGFDRLFTTPSFPLIVVESKVNRFGKLHLGRPQTGEQGSAAWVAAQAAKMADPDSAQYSPENARLAALIQELGPENIPVVTVVIQKETGAADVYCRPAGTATWRRLPAGGALNEAFAVDDS